MGDRNMFDDIPEDGPYPNILYCKSCSRAVGTSDNQKLGNHEDGCTGDEIVEVSVDELIDQPIQLSKRFSQLLIQYVTHAADYFVEKDWDLKPDEDNMDKGMALMAARMGNYIQDSFGYGKFSRFIGIALFVETMMMLFQRTKQELDK